ncbi:uncharacterized protein K02A2.6-like [Sycon ciliatum]|uniref:uncharacterized protein K02A2.6-like n=1 Tax=Sycon ciliatum TaxID=27933 RepID=UPI0031F6EB46
MAVGSRPPPRIERMVLRLQDLSFQLQYKPGPENPADVLSRNPQPHPDLPNVGAQEDTAYIHALATAAKPNALALKEIADATTTDTTLQAVLSSLQTGRWDSNHTTVRPYFALRHELSESDGLLLRNDRLVIPTALQRRTLQLAHAGHQGIVRTKQRLNSKVWWPNMATEAEALCRQCIACQATLSTTPLRPESVPTPPSTTPWQRVFVDLYGPMPNGQHLLATIDQLTRYPVINVFSTTPTTAGVVKALRSTFSMFGLPEELVSDNGPQFRSSAFADFLAQHAIQHRRTPPLWPQANGAVERLNRTIGKVLQTAKLAGEDINVALDQWLLAYRNTPHPATHEAPATLMFGRPIRDSIPCITPTAPDLPSAAHRDQQFRQSQCDAANATRRSNAPILTPGQRVLRRNEQAHNKLSPQWDPNPWTVDRTSGSTVTISNPATGQRSTRHMSFVKPVIVVTPPAHHPLPADSAATTPAPGPPAVNTGTQAVPRQQPSRAAKSAHSTVTPPPP